MLRDRGFVLSVVASVVLLLLLRVVMFAVPRSAPVSRRACGYL